MFCEITDFELPPYNIPNLADPSDENASDGTFEAYVDQEEEKELRFLMGEELYEQFTLGLAAVTPDVWWTRLRDGYTYNVGGKNYLWKGLKWMLIPYIWYRWTSDNEVKKTQEGGSLASAENSERVSLANELAKAYNEYAFNSGFAECTTVKNSFYGMLTSDPTNYGSWDPSEADIEYINPWNI